MENGLPLARLTPASVQVVLRADHLIDLGPEAGDGGGEVVFAGTPEELVKKGTGHTAVNLKGRIG